MNRSLASFSESRKHISLSSAFKHPFICAHLQSVTIFWELYAYISEQNGGFFFCLDYFLLHIPEQLLMWQEGTDISMDLDNLWLWELFKMFFNYFLFLYCFLYNPFLYTWVSVEAFMFHPQYERSSNEQCVHFEGGMVLTAASVQIPNAGVWSWQGFVIGSLHVCF